MEPKTHKDVVGVLVTGVLTLGGNIALVFMGQQYITSAIGSVIYSLAPLITAAFAFFWLLIERLDRLGGVGVVLGFIGAGIVANPDISNLLTATNQGVVLVFLSVTSFAVGNVITRRVDPDLPSLTLTTWGLVVAAVFVHSVSPGSLLLGEQVTITTVTGLVVIFVGFVFIEWERFWTSVSNIRHEQI